ncbi:hypothetical protein RvY_02218 [Ramazzottius varieornatus]|uniref:Uncharacterized protein n=1 Tax=Ramazzottius varieornatus TaxID=947166 RepID=A0A1D1UPW6_RAMVA|nr:hypothetical protein RvY_02218 [Ramazzottius varieornatus]
MANLGILLMVICCTFVYTTAQSTFNDDDLSSWEGTSVVGHDPRLLYNSGAASRHRPIIRRNEYAQSFARRPPPYFSQRVFGRIADRQSPPLSENLSKEDKEGLYWMSPPTPQVKPAPLMPRGPSMMASWDFNAPVPLEAPNIPFWALLSAPRRSRSHAIGVSAYNDDGN